MILEEVSGMKTCNWRCLFLWTLIAFAGLFMIGGCDSGEKAIDEVTGNRAVKQYHKTKKDIENIAEKQAERYGTIPGDNEEEGNDQK